MIPDDVSQCLDELRQHGGLVEDWLEPYESGETAKERERSRKFMLMTFLQRLEDPSNETHKEEFQKIRLLGEQVHSILTEDGLYKQACAGEKFNFRAVQTFLERRDPTRWSKTVEKKGKQLTAEDLAKMEEEMFERGK